MFYLAFVCRVATSHENYWSYLHENLSLDNDVSIKFWKLSASISGCKNFSKDCLRLWERTFFHKLALANVCDLQMLLLIHILFEIQTEQCRSWITCSVFELYLSLLLCLFFVMIDLNTSLQHRAVGKSMQQSIPRLSDSWSSPGTMLPDEQSLIHRMHVFRMRLLHFVNSLHDYIMTRVKVIIVIIISIISIISIIISWLFVLWNKLTTDTSKWRTERKGFELKTFY